MEFRVTRTSIWSNASPPCKEAKLVTRKGEKVYVIQLNSLAELKKFVNDIKTSVIVDIDNDNNIELEIYDDYRE